MDEQEHILIEEHLHFFSTACSIARLYNYLGRFDAALNLLQAAEHISYYPEAMIGRFEFLRLYAEIRMADYFLNNRGSDEMFALVERIYQEERESAAEAYGEELDFTYGNNGNTINVAIAMCLLGQAHYYYTLNTHGNNYDKTFAYCQQALNIWEKLEKERQIFTTDWDDPTSEEFKPDEYARNYVLRIIEGGMSKALFYLGLAYERLEKDEQARASYQRALDLALRADAKEEASYAYRHLAGFCKTKEQQLEYALQSLALREEIGFKRLLPHSHLLVCDVYLLCDDLEKAQEHCRAAFQLAEEMDAKSVLMMVFYSQGEIAQHQGRLDEARAYFIQSLELAEKLGVGYGIAEATKKLQELG